MPALSTPIRRFCKDILQQYPLMKKELAALEREKQAIAGAVPIATWQHPTGGNTVADKTASQTMKLLRLEEAWSKTRFYVQAVDDVLACLNEEQRRLVKFYYFDGLPIWKVAQELCISEATFYRANTAILALLAHRLGL